MKLRIALLTGIAAVLVLGAGTANAATIPVTTTQDVVANDDDLCSLREAVDSANQNAANGSGCVAGQSSTDTIVLGGLEYSLSKNGHDEDNVVGDLDVDTDGGDVVIQGSGSSQVEGDFDYFSGGSDRLLDVRGGGTTTVKSVWFYGGRAGTERGGAVRSQDTNLILDGSRASGSGAWADQADIPISQQGGGGLYAGGGTLVLRNGSAVTGNTLQHQRSDTNNGETFAGGGILLDGGVDATIDETTVSSNTVTSSNQTMVNAGGGIAIAGSGNHVTISNSTISGNYAYGGADPSGQGIYWGDDSGTLNIENSTIAQNGVGSYTLTASPPEITAAGGTVKAANITVAGNLLPSGYAWHGPALEWTANGGSFTIRGSILSDGADQDMECVGDPITSEGYNLEDGPNNDCGFAGPGDVVADAGLTTLANSGGKTSVKAPTDPAAFGNIPAGDCLDTEGNHLDRDQRGAVRAAGAACDSGSVQFDCGGKSPTIVGTTGADVIPGTNGDDVIAGLGGDDTINAGDGNDTICGNAGADTLNGEGGNDTILPGDNQTTYNEKSIDAIDGGSGTNTLSYREYAGIQVSANLLTGTTTATTGPDSITNIQNLEGALTGSVLAGDGNDNELRSAPDSTGSDTLVGNGGDDTLIGNTKTEYGTTASFTGAPGPVTVNLQDGTATGDGNDTLQGIRNVAGTSGDDTYIPSAENNRFTCNGGHDKLDYSHIPVGAGGVDVRLIYAYPKYSGATGPGTGQDEWDPDECIDDVIGSPNDDTIVANGHDNHLDGGAGNDTASWDEADGGPITANLAAGSASGGDTGSDTFTGFENLTGSDETNDTLIGDGGVNILDGGLGNDTMDGAGGNDAVKFGVTGHPVVASLATHKATGQGEEEYGINSGEDTFTNIEGVIGSDRNDTITGDNGDNVLRGGPGVDTVDYSPAAGPVIANEETGVVTGGAGNDTLSGFETINGSPFDDQLTGDVRSNTLNGGGGNDILDGSLGDDRLNGGPGSNTVSFQSNPQAVEVDLALNTAEGQGLDAFTDVQNAFGSPVGDLILEDGRDNAIDGGGGADTVSFVNATSGINANLAAGMATGDGTDSLSNVENLLGSPQDDMLHGNGADNELNGGLGTDTLSFAGGPSVSASIAGASATGDGSDSLSSIENLIGSDGADTLIGDGGPNQIDGGAGDDTLDPKSGADSVLAGAGADIVRLRDGDADIADCGSGADVDDVTADARGTDELTNCENDRLSYLGEPTEGPVGGGSPPGPPAGGNPAPAPPSGGGKPKVKSKKCKGKKAKKKKCKRKGKKGKKK